jgi:hypothetical protein
MWSSFSYPKFFISGSVITRVVICVLKQAMVSFLCMGIVNSGSSCVVVVYILRKCVVLKTSNVRYGEEVSYFL